MTSVRNNSPKPIRRGVQRDSVLVTGWRKQKPFTREPTLRPGRNPVGGAFGRRLRLLANTPPASPPPAPARRRGLNRAGRRGTAGSSASRPRPSSGRFASLAWPGIIPGQPAIASRNQRFLAMLPAGYFLLLRRLTTVRNRALSQAYG